MDRLADFYNYHIGMLGFLEIRRYNMVDGNIFNIIYGCTNFNLSIPSICGAYLVALLFSIIITQFLIVIYKHFTLKRQKS
jgi:hypothetical protein